MLCGEYRSRTGDLPESFRDAPALCPFRNQILYIFSTLLFLYGGLGLRCLRPGNKCLLPFHLPVLYLFGVGRTVALVMAVQSDFQIFAVAHIIPAKEFAVKYIGVEHRLN